VIKEADWEDIAAAVALLDNKTKFDSFRDIATFVSDYEIWAYADYEN
jgi:hypothetical protein